MLDYWSWLAYLLNLQFVLHPAVIKTFKNYSSDFKLFNRWVDVHPYLKIAAMDDRKSYKRPKGGKLVLKGGVELKKK